MTAKHINMPMNNDFECIVFPAVNVICLNIIFYSHFFSLSLRVVEGGCTPVIQTEECLLDFCNFGGDSFLIAFCSASEMGK